jgi:hypothetical protein
MNYPVQERRVALAGADLADERERAGLVAGVDFLEPREHVARRCLHLELLQLDDAELVQDTVEADRVAREVEPQLLDHLGAQPFVASVDGAVDLRRRQRRRGRVRMDFAAQVHPGTAQRRWTRETGD